MHLRLKPSLFVAFVFCVPFLLHAELIRIAAYNVQHYLDQPTETRRVVKSTEAKAKIRESIHALKPDIISFEEMGSTNALLELRDSLKAEGIEQLVVQGHRGYPLFRADHEIHPHEVIIDRVREVVGRQP